MLKPFRLLDALLALKRRFVRRPGPASGVLLISAGGLGDTVLFALLASRFSALARDGEAVTVLLRRDAAKMAFVLPVAFGLEIVDFNRFRKSLGYRRKAANRLFRAHYRLVVSTDQLRHPDLDEALLAMATPEQAFAMEPRSWSKYDARLRRNRRLYDRLFDSGPDRLDKVVRWTRFVNWLTGDDAPPPKVRLDLETAGEDTPDVLIQPFSAVAAKQSPAGLYARIIDALPEGTTVAITGALGDRTANPDFEELLTRDNVRFDASPFQDLAPALKAAKLVISVDTAAMHLAAALGAPTLCLASAAYVGEIVPYADEIMPGNVRFLYQGMDCEGCLGDCRLPFVDGMYPCIAALDEDKAVQWALEMLRA